MPGVVVDASALIEVVLRTAAGARAAAVLRDASALAAPAHIDAEVLSALGRLVRSSSLDESVARSALSQVARAPIDRYAIAPLLDGAWALRDNIALRDALYVELAGRLGASLLTIDGRLASAPGLVVPVIFIAMRGNVERATLRRSST